MYRSINLNNIRAKGWAAEYLKNQSAGLTGHLDEVHEPFATKYWDSNEAGYIPDDDVFLGGMTVIGGLDKWVVYEQTGYWIDGMVRCAHLIDDEWLYEKVKPKLYMPIENADEEGYIGPAFLKDNMVWAHSVYFRSLMAEYEATGNEIILEALKKHFLRAPLKDVFHKHYDVRIMKVRDIADIEIALWIYDKTKDNRFLTMAEESYKLFNKIFENDKGTAPHAKMRPLTIKGMTEEGNARNNHGVTYCELCKLAAILYMHTDKEIYKKAAVNAFDKVYKENILIDGVISSSEYLNGNDNSHACHETCDVSDFTWALGYLFMITGDYKYSDWVEDAVLNGGFGAVSDDFKSSQYFSCPNQVLANDTSNHNRFFRGKAWMSYAPAGSFACCTGNVNRFFPNFIARSWMQKEDVITPFVYAPTTAEFEINNKTVKISEETKYPFENTVKFMISAKEKTKFTLKLRVPGWAVKSSLVINGIDAGKYLEGNVYEIKREYKDGDIIEISFDDKIEFVKNAGGVSIKKGPLLYALPITEKIVIEDEVRGIGNPKYPHFSLYADSKWNYGLDMKDENKAVFNPGGTKEFPWKLSDNELSITLPLCEIKSWELTHCTRVRTYQNPRKKGKVMDCDFYITPVVPKKGSFEYEKSEIIKLVPYCTTRLRIAIFPICSK